MAAGLTAGSVGSPNDCGSRLSDRHARVAYVTSRPTRSGSLVFPAGATARTAASRVGRAHKVNRRSSGLHRMKPLDA